MMRSTLLLVKMFRVRLTLCMAVGFAWAFIRAMGGAAWPLDTDVLKLVPTVAFMLVLCMSLHGLLGDTIFLVTDRQLAWIPLAAWGALMIAGVAGLVAGQVVTLHTGPQISMTELVQYYGQAIRLWPPVLLILMLAWRGLRINFGFIGFFCFFPALAIAPGKGGLVPPWVYDFYFACWPAWVVLCAFFVWEAPRQTAVLRRFDEVVENRVFFTKMRVPVLGGPARPSWPTRLADALMGFIIAVVFLVFAYGLVAAFAPHPMASFRKFPFVVFFLPVLFLPFGGAINLFRANRASGLGVLGSACVAAIELTGLGYPYRDYLGVKRGTVVACPFCGGRRMAWAERCMHCGDASPVAEKKFVFSPGILSVLFPRHDPVAMFFRVGVATALMGQLLALNAMRWMK